MKNKTGTLRFVVKGTQVKPGAKKGTLRFKKKPTRRVRPSRVA